VREGLLFFLLVTASALGRPGPLPPLLKSKDVAFFFSSIRTEGGDWIYLLSPQTRDMRWDLQGGARETSGNCRGVTELRVGQNEALELANDLVDLRIFRWQGLGRPFREADLKIAQRPEYPVERAALVEVTSQHQLELSPIPNP
jgi:hypothetical protein